MSVLNNSLLLGADAGGYTISRSLRFNSADSAYLSRTPASAGNRKTFTVACWVKRSVLGTTQYIWEGGSPDGYSTRLALRFTTADVLSLITGGIAFRVTTQVFRDPSAWYHIVVAFDTANSTAANRVRVYVNGVEITTFTTSNDPSQNDDTGWNMAASHSIGRSHIDSVYSNLYLADFHNIDGQALTPTSFGEFSATTGVWMPKAYTGTYGTNGFRLTFADNSAATATTLGKDAAGSSNWTPNNLSVTAGAGNDSLVDVPTNGSETDTGAGGQVRGNYPTWNPLKRFNVNVALANGNLDTSVSQTASTEAAVATFALPTTGKWYWEITLQTYTNASADVFIGVGTIANATQNTASNLTSGGGYYRGNGTITNLSNSAQTSGGTWSQGDIIGIAVDVGAGTAQFYKNNVAQGATPSFSFTAGTELVPYIANDNSANAKVTNANFGQRPFAYTAPSGFKALCTANLPAPLVTKPSTVMDVALYTGTGANLAVSGLGFSPDFIWTKARSAVDNHILVDQIRGVGNILLSNSTQAESAYSAFVSFDSNGFTKAAAESVNGRTYAAWTWDAGSSTVTNTQGSISSQVRANASAGFSVVTYTGNGTTGTVGHGLGVAPGMVIIKSRSDGAANWTVWHSGLTNGYYIYLNTTGAQTNTSASQFFGNTSTTVNPSSTVITLGGANAVNNSSPATYVAYCFAPVAGYSAFGSYTGNGTTNRNFIYTGFTPRTLIVKRTSSSGTNWRIIVPGQVFLSPNTADSEYASLPGPIQALANGFEIFGGADINDASQTYIYAAFAESPFGLNNRAR
jgi:hypothetical protein